MIGLLSSTAQAVHLGFIQIFGGTTKINIKFAKILPNISDLKQISQNRTSLVDRKSKNIEWEKFKTSETVSGDSNRWFYQGLGSSLQWGLNRRNMVKWEIDFSYKRFETIGSKNCSFHIHKREVHNYHSYSNGQQDFLFVFSEYCGKSQQATARYNQTNYLEIITGLSDHDYCRIPPKQTECESRLGVLTCREQFKMETFARGIPVDRENFLVTNNRPLCIRTVPPDETVCSLETRPQQYKDQCNATTLESGSGLCSPSILLGKSNYSKCWSRKKWIIW